MRWLQIQRQMTHVGNTQKNVAITHPLLKRALFERDYLKKLPDEAAIICCLPRQFSSYGSSQLHSFTGACQEGRSVEGRRIRRLAMRSLCSMRRACWRISWQAV